MGSMNVDPRFGRGDRVQGEKIDVAPSALPTSGLEALRAPAREALSATESSAPVANKTSNDWGCARLIEDIRNSWEGRDYLGTVLRAGVGSIPLAGGFIGKCFVKVGAGLIPNSEDVGWVGGIEDATHPGTYRTGEDALVNLAVVVGLNVVSLAFSLTQGALGTAIFITGKCIELPSHVAAEAVRMIVGKP